MADSNPSLVASPPRIAVVGCGAIAELFHAPALARHPGVRDRLIFVDRDLARAQLLKEQSGGGRVSADLGDVLPEVDGVVLAVPPKLHVPMTRQCVAAGTHVLCEKPLAESSDEVTEIIDAASANGAKVGVNHIRRLFGASGLVKEIVESGTIGTPRSFEYLQGEQFDWPAATSAYFGAAAGRGVLADLGSHILDLASWWLGGPMKLESYADDSRGGTEAVAWVDFSVGECRGSVRLSWLTRYANTYRVTGDEGSVRGHLFDERSVELLDTRGKVRERRSAPRSVTANRMLDGFLEAVAGDATPPVTAEDVLPSVRLIEECYANRTRLEDPWYPDATARAAS